MKTQKSHPVYSLSHSSKHSPAIQGFSLVELSIVLVILGLLTGGILGGSALIRAAELRSVTTQLTAYQTAVNAFKAKYMALPGDMKNATQFWGESTACGGGESEGVCNGDGDKRIFLDISGNYSSGDTPEATQFWRHLAKAGLVSGQYTGQIGPDGKAHHVAGETSPGRKISGTLWAARYYITGGTAAHFNLLNLPGNHLSFGLPDANGWPHAAALLPSELWSIDQKTDDGKPAKGRVISAQWDRCTTATSRDNLDAEYNLAIDETLCAPWVLNLF